MLARIKAMQVGRSGLRLAAVLAGSQLTVAAAKVGTHSAHAANCAGEGAFHIAAALGQTAWSILDACLIGQLAHATGVLLAADSSFSPVHAAAAIIGHEVYAHLVSFVFRILS